MIYRRFGKTELEIPVVSCGGMRYQASWQSDDPVPDDNQRNLEATIRRAVELGINHIETARGYGTSEYQLGKVLPTFDRDKIIVQTKVGPNADPAKFEQVLTKSIGLLNLDHVDLFAFHGINTHELLEHTKTCWPVVERWRKDGRIRFVGFSTHGPTNVIVDAIETGLFDYVNLHWYWVFQDNWPAIEAATRHDMGVFIISPNDKGGKLYEPSEKLCRLTAPLHPMTFNGLFCLSRPEVHTISCGASRPTDFDIHIETVEQLDGAQELVAPIEARLNTEAEAILGVDWWRGWRENLPEWDATPGGVNIPWILRLRNLALAFDMTAYGKMRYNLLGKGDHWFPGNKADDVMASDLAECLKESSFKDDIPAVLEEAHSILSGMEVSRLQE